MSVVTCVFTTLGTFGLILYLSAQAFESEEIADLAGPAQCCQWPAGVMSVFMVDAVRRMLGNTDDVGERFPEGAHRIHCGKIEACGICGQATPEERRALRDEGIEIMSLPMPAALKGPVQ